MARLYERSIYMKDMFICSYYIPITLLTACIVPIGSKGINKLFAIAQNSSSILNTFIREELKENHVDI